MPPRKAGLEGLVGLGPGTPGAPTTNRQQRRDVMAIDLAVAQLLPALPPLHGEPETVAVAELLRYGCLADVARNIYDSWDAATDAQAAGPEYLARLRRIWRDRVAAYVVPTDAAWWIEHGRQERTAIRAALEIAAPTAGQASR